MNANLAEENLQTIRVLMERSAVYRRALAPIVLLAGTLGLAAAGVGLACHFESSRAFAGLWLGTACVVVSASFLLARRQALKDHEPFWSPPTCRVGQALLPPLVSGLSLGGTLILLSDKWSVNFPMALVWMLFYGCALHSAGFFMVRGIKWFGWIYIVSAMALMLLVNVPGIQLSPRSAHWVMGGFFGALHLVYGIYLNATEKQSAAA